MVCRRKLLRWGVPCVTLREQTERPITITEGTNRLVDWPVSENGVLSGFLARTGGPQEQWQEQAAAKGLGWPGQRAIGPGAGFFPVISNRGFPYSSTITGAT